MGENSHVKNFGLKSGPKGLGDPDDTALRRVELDIKIPQKLREKARDIKCANEVKAFNDCATENGIMLFANCRKVNNIMKDCLVKWYNDEDFKNECTKEYLQERSEYRRTGIPIKTYQRTKH